jgi:hypothetical protein
VTSDPPPGLAAAAVYFIDADMSHWRNPIFYALFAVGWAVGFVILLGPATLLLPGDAVRSPVFVAMMQVPSVLFGYFLGRVCLPKPVRRGFSVRPAPPREKAG